MAALRRFLDRGGTLFINSGLGLKSFDSAVRRELKKLLPEHSLLPIPSDHALFHRAREVGDIEYSARVAAERPGLRRPLLEGISLSGDLKIVYSPMDLEAGWEGVEHPSARTCDPASALALGMNIVVSPMTH